MPRPNNIEAMETGGKENTYSTKVDIQVGNPAQRNEFRIIPVASGYDSRLRHVSAGEQGIQIVLDVNQELQGESSTDPPSDGECEAENDIKIERKPSKKVSALISQFNSVVADPRQHSQTLINESTIPPKKMRMHVNNQCDGVESPSGLGEEHQVTETHHSDVAAQVQTRNVPLSNVSTLIVIGQKEDKREPNIVRMEMDNTKTLNITPLSTATGDGSKSSVSVKDKPAVKPRSRQNIATHQPSPDQTSNEKSLPAESKQRESKSKSLGRTDSFVKRMAMSINRSSRDQTTPNRQKETGERRKGSPPRKHLSSNTGMRDDKKNVDANENIISTVTIHKDVHKETKANDPSPEDTSERTRPESTKGAQCADLYSQQNSVNFHLGSSITINSQDARKEVKVYNSTSVCSNAGINRTNKPQTFAQDNALLDSRIPQVPVDNKPTEDNSSVLVSESEPHKARQSGKNVESSTVTESENHCIHQLSNAHISVPGYSPLYHDTFTNDSVQREGHEYPEENNGQTEEMNEYPEHPYIGQEQRDNSLSGESTTDTIVNESEDVGDARSEYSQASLRINNALNTLKSELMAMREQDLALLKQLINISQTIQRIHRSRVLRVSKSLSFSSSQLLHHKPIQRRYRPLERQNSAPHAVERRRFMFSNLTASMEEEIGDSLSSFDESEFDSQSELEESTSSLNSIFSPNSPTSPKSRTFSNSRVPSATFYVGGGGGEDQDQSYEDILRRNVRLWKLRGQEQKSVVIEEVTCLI